VTRVVDSSISIRAAPRLTRKAAAISVVSSVRARFFIDHPDSWCRFARNSAGFAASSACSSRAIASETCRTSSIARALAAAAIARDESRISAVSRNRPSASCRSAKGVSSCGSGRVSYSGRGWQYSSDG
jgi:hypothetical protein